MIAALKFIMTLSGLLLIGATIGTVLLLTQFEGVLRSGLTRQAGQIMKAEVHLEAVRIDWTLQALEFRGISIFNPEGYADREALHIDSVMVYPQMLAIFAKTPVVRQISLKDTTLYLQRQDETTNLGAMMNSARSWADEQGRGEAWVLGRPLKVEQLASAPIVLTLDPADASPAETPLTLESFTVETPAGDDAASGARVIHLVLQSIALQIANLDGVAQSVRDTLRGETRADETELAVPTESELLPDAPLP